MPEEKLASQCKTTILKIGVIGSTISALASDVFKPMANFTLYFLIGLGITLLLMLALYILDKANLRMAHEINEWLKDFTGGYWFRVIFISILLMVIVFFIIFLFNRNTENGILAERSQAVRVLQEGLGLVNIHLATIAGNTSAMVEEQRKSNEILSDIAYPKDPRAALGKLGVAFTIGDFRDVVSEGDIEKAELFLRAGIDPYATDPNYYPRVPVLVSAVLENWKNYEKIIAMAVEISHFNPDFTFPLDRNARETFGSILYSELNEFFLNPKELVYLNEEIDFKRQEYDLGFLIPIMRVVPDSRLLDFLKRYKISTSTGLPVRKEIYNQYDAVLSSNFGHFKKLYGSHAPVKIDYATLRTKLENALLKYKEATEEYQTFSR